MKDSELASMNNQVLETAISSDSELEAKLKKYKFDRTDTFQVKDNYVHRQVAGSDMLISIGENIANFNGYIEMNESAAYIWDHMKEPCTVGELGQSLTEEFEVDLVHAMEDVLEFLSELREHDMVVIGRV